MNLDTIKNSIGGLFTKSQKARYAMSASGSPEKGQPAPMQFSPEIREKIYRTPMVFMSINTIAEEVAKVDWEIVPKHTVLDEVGYGTREGKSNAVLSTKEYQQLRTKYSSSQRQEISTKTKEHIAQVYALLEDPNENKEGFTEIRKKIATDLKIHDAAAIEKIFNGVNEVVEIYTAPAAYIKQNYDKNGKLLSPAYYQADPQFPTTNIAQWNKEELVYMMLNPISTSMYGVSPVDVIGQIVATLVNALNYNGTYFESAALPEGFFTLPNLTENQARRLMKTWEEEIKSKHHKVVFMPEGAKWQQFRFSNVEMQWLQGQKFYSEIVFAVLGVTKHELGFTEDVNKATAEQQSFVFKNKSLIPMLNVMAEKINQEIIGKLGFGFDDVMFIFKNVDLADKDTMDKIHDRAVKSGRMTINEAREESGKTAYKDFGDQPVIATSQGLVFLEQFKMKFDEYKEEQDWIAEQARAAKVPVAEMRRRLMPAVKPGNGDTSNNSDAQPKSPPSAPTPRADENAKANEGKKSILISGLEALTSTIKQAVEDDENEEAV